MSAHHPQAGLPVWLELNAQAAVRVQRFYQDLFAWRMGALHVPPMGTMPVFASGEYAFANVFTALGAFAPPRWLVRLGGDADAAAQLVEAHGGTLLGEPSTIEGHGRAADFLDPSGLRGTVLTREGFDAERPVRAGEPIAAELWSPAAKELGPFYAALLGLEWRESDLGGALFDGAGRPRVFFCATSYELSPPRFIPYFRTCGLQADGRRIELMGGVRQMPDGEQEGLGTLGIFADPIGCFFGLVEANPA